MKRLCLILAALTAALAAPALAHAGGATLRVVDVGPGERSLAAVSRFDLLAFKGPGPIRFRVHRLQGGWSGWLTADDDPTWTGAADAFRVRSPGKARAYEIWSPVEGQPVRALAEAGSPAIVSRSGWKANDEILRGKPAYAPALRLAIVHHTVNANDYTPAEAAAIVRGIELYHVQGNGWNDIGYNFLVDRFGNVYEGRAGGITRNVIGAHAEGFNRGTVGIALIGNFAKAKPTQAMENALVRLLAWRLDLAHVDPLSTVAYASGGNAKFKAGKVVTLRAVSGHRDTGPSECPGKAAYDLLGRVAKEAAAIGLPKLYSPTVAGALGGDVRFQARLSSSLPWTVTVADTAGRAVASGKGTGSTVDWTWHAAVPTGASYRWTIAAPGLRVASGTLGKAPPAPAPLPALSALSATQTTVAFTLNVAAQVEVHVLDAGGATVLQAFAGQRPAGPSAVNWDSSALAEGRYRLVVTATAGGASATKWVDIVVDRTATGLTAQAGDAGTTQVSFTLAAPAPVTLAVEQGAATVAQVFSGVLQAGDATVSWDRTSGGKPLAAGDYTVVLTVTDALGAVRFTVPLTLP
ncbi:MAG TPA: FlgD immunoglobulin-like domain containing protein [Gaiellaceae bacterium]|nr:FlgD immunoglobulin-like domain containing protein [Gaiellaceae bacterium]